jgi:hypothetical protein
MRPLNLNYHDYVRVLDHVHVHDHDHGYGHVSENVGKNENVSGNDYHENDRFGVHVLLIIRLNKK